MTAAEGGPGGRSAGVVVSTNPADGDMVAVVQAAGADGVRRAVARAGTAQPRWLAAGAAARAAALCAAADALAAEAGALTALAVREVGKPVTEAAAEVARTVAVWRYYAQLAYDPSGSVHEPAAGAGLLITRRRPYGVAGLITPWNFPLAIPSWKSAPALAAGNAVVLKPAPEATACALYLGELLAQVLPHGVFTVVPGGAPEGAELVEAADVVSFTGSDAAGRAVIRSAAGRGVPVQAETGGLNAAIVLPDADIGRTAAHIAAAVAGYAGQKCTATSRVIAVGTAYPHLRDALAAELAALPAADPEDPATVCGPVISAAAASRVRDARDGAVAGGARLLAGGDGRSGGFVSPVLLEAVAAGHPLLTEEVFGPIAVLLAADDLSDAVRRTCEVRQGLVSSVHTGDLDQALLAAEQLDTGMVRINAPSTGVDFHLPFGGAKTSGYGPRELGAGALDFYTAGRTISLMPGRAA